MDERLRKVEAIAGEVCQRHGVSLYDLVMKNTRKGKVLIVYITKIDGVTVGDCQNVSRELSDILELEDVIVERYFLEVSSPGLERELRLKKHYVSAINETVKITYDLGDERHSIKGKLKEVLEGKIKVEVNSNLLEIPFSAIKKARTFFDYKR